MTTSITEIRSTIREQNHTLTETALLAIRHLAELPVDRLLTPEYGRAEYLANCDEGGRLVRASAQLDSALTDFTPKDPPWILIVDEQILTLRWLAHFVGLRHRAIHLFLDHPEHPDSTFLQVRSLSKYNAPGAFDMPLGGHCEGLDSFDRTLEKELKEELGLNVATDLQNVREVGTHQIELSDYQPDYSEYEVSVVYRAEIRPEAFGKIRLQEGEVGGIVLFDCVELDRWISERPEQLGGGLVDSWPYYGYGN